MSSKNKIAILIFIVVASVSFWLYLHSSKSTIRKELYDFAIDDTASVTKIYMVNTAGKQVTLEKIKPGNWQVNGKFKARTDAMKILLSTMKDLRVRNPVAKTAIEPVSKQLATSGTKVEIYRGDKLAKMYYVGADTQDGLGTFMLLTDAESGENSTLPFIMFIPGFNGFLSVRYFADEEEWRDRHVFALYPDEISSISVQFKRFPDSSYTFSLNDKNEISLADSKGKNIPVFDTIKAKRYITYYSNISFEGLKNDMRASLKDSLLANGPVHIITLKERNGKIHTVKTFALKAHPSQINPVTNKSYEEDPERMDVLLDEKDFAVVQYFVFGKLFIGISNFLHKDASVSKNPIVKK
ncbi:MAG: hypothetical protein HY063_12270 [Bacteroidetes bacterium]|nr:hypothetical protein [Bacteroidota bacterium]